MFRGVDWRGGLASVGQTMQFRGLGFKDVAKVGAWVFGFGAWGSTFQGPLKEEHSCKKACSSVKLKWDLALYETTTYNLSPTTPDA